MNFIKNISVLVFTFCSLVLFSQVPQAINYQTVVNGSNGTLANRSVSFRFSILQGSITGTAVYVETQTATTSSGGLVTFAIGNGTPVTDTFSNINWTNSPYFLEVDVDTAGGSNYVTLSKTQLLSVPYALYAQSAGSVVNGSGFVHYVGELYGGGIVVGVWKISGVEHGLVASLNDLSGNSVWSNIDSTAVGPTAESNTDGVDNTAAIIAQAGQTTSAALLCQSYSGGGFNDWYLPSINELNMCFNAFSVVNIVLGTNGFTTYAFYWSSTENNSTTAWGQGYNIRGSTSAKTDNATVRAVRSY